MLCFSGVCGTITSQGFLLNMKKTNDKKGFVIYNDWETRLNKVPAENQARFLRNLFKYHSGRKDELELDDIIDVLLWEGVVLPLQMNIEKWENKSEKSRENGKLGGRPPEPKETQQVNTEPKETNQVNTEPKETNQVISKPKETQQHILEPKEPVKSEMVNGNSEKEIINSEKSIENNERRMVNKEEVNKIIKKIIDNPEILKNDFGFSNLDIINIVSIMPSYMLHIPKQLLESGWRYINENTINVLNRYKEEYRMKNEN